MKERS